MDIHSGGSANPADKTGNALGPEIDASQVSQDMEDIFGAAKPFPNGKPSPPSRAIVALVARSHDRTMRSPRARSLILPGVAIAGALAVTMALAQFGGLNRYPNQIVEPPTLPAPRLADVHHSAALVQPQAIPAAPASVAREYATGPSAAVEAPPKLIRTTYHPKQKPKKRRVMTSVKSKAHMTFVKSEADMASVKSQADRSCLKLDRLELAWCMRPQLVDADRQLRNAYTDAVRAGVDRRLLVSYRNQWSRLRKRANSDPRYVLVRYRQMAQALDGERTYQLAGDS